MTGEYGASVGLPLLISLALVGALTAALVLRGAAAEAFLERPWSRWVLLVTLVFLAANQLLVRGVAAGIWDADGQFFPFYVLVADHARAFRIALWDPWSNGGLPLTGDPQAGAFSPLAVAAGLVTGGTSAGFRGYWLLSWWLGGVGVLMLGRHLGAPAWGAAAAALGFLFCGVYTGNAEHTSWIAAFSFLPLILWRVDRALDSGALGPAVQAGALWGLSGLGGYPGIVMITGCFVGVWSLGRWLAPERRPAVAGRRAPTAAFTVTALALVLLVGVLVLSPAYLGFFIEAAGASSRVGALTRAVAISDALEPGAVATFASPVLTALKAVSQLIGSDGPSGKLWPATDVSMVNIYAGAIIPSLALFGLFHARRDPWRWWLAGMAVLSLATAMGEALPLRGWLYDWLYPMRFFRHSAIFRLFFVFSVTALALLATRDLAAALRDPRPGARRRYFLATLLVAVCATLAVIPFVNDPRRLAMPTAAVALGRLHFVWLWSGICVISWMAWRSLSQTRAWLVPVLLLALAAGDALLTQVLSIPTMLRLGEGAARWQELDARHRATLDLTDNGWRREPSACEPHSPAVRCRRNDQLITKVPVFNSYATEKNPFHLAMVHHPVLGGMATGTERVWFATRVGEVAVSERSFESFRRRAEELGAPPLVVQAPSVEPPGETPPGSTSAGDSLVIAGLPAAERIRADVMTYRPDELVLEVAPAADGWLLVTDRWARSWRADVNGVRTPVHRGNYIFRAIRITAGRHRVRFSYVPVAWPWLLIVSWGTLAAVGGWSMATGIRRRRA
jgi:hypothetical protein